MTAPAHPYSPPLSVDARVPRPPVTRWRKIGALAAVGVALFGLGFSFLAAGVEGAVLPLLLGTLAFGTATIVAIRQQIRLLVAPVGLVSAWAVIGNAAVVLAALGASAFGALTAFVSTLSFTRGRQVRRFGKQVFAELVDSSGSPAVDGDGDGPADAWRRNGLTEHASVAAFARLSLELMALGAPRRLLDAAHADAIDESRHTDLCFELASRIDGRTIVPGPFPSAAALPARGPRTWRLCRLAVDSLIDGAINEGVSARVVASLAKDVEDPAIAAVLESIARDEARHAAHGFEVLAWCVAVGGAPVAAAVAGALERLPERLGDALHDDARDGRWEHIGIPGRAREAEAFEVVRRRTTKRVHRLLG